MSTKNTGTGYRFIYNNIEYPIQSAGYSSKHNEEDTTDSSTAPDSTESIIGRTKREIKVSALLHGDLGAEIDTGTLVKDTKYIVTASVTTFHSLYAVGIIFISDGTETCTSSEKVKPLGIVLNGKDMSISFAGTLVPVTDLKFDEKYKEDDVTDTGTTGNAMESTVGRGTRTGNLTMIQRQEDSDLLTTADPSNQAVIITLGTSQTITGTGIFKSKDVNGNTDGSAAKVAYDYNFVGSVTKALAGLIPFSSVAQSAHVVMAKGTTTDKAVTGNAVMTGLSITGDAKGSIKVDYTFTFNGTPTETVLS